MGPLIFTGFFTTKAKSIYTFPINLKLISLEMLGWEGLKWDWILWWKKRVCNVKLWIAKLNSEWRKITLVAEPYWLGHEAWGQKVLVSVLKGFMHNKVFCMRALKLKGQNNEAIVKIYPQHYELNLWLQTYFYHTYMCFICQKKNKSVPQLYETSLALEIEQR